MTFRTSALAALTVALAACDRDDIYGESTFSQNVAEAYAECDAGEIQFLTGKHALSLAFKPCGSNKFSAATWSPDGSLLYFQLTHGGHILVGETGDIETIPTETPVGPAAWLRDDYLAIPLAPSGTVELGSSEEVAHKQAAQAEGPWRLALYNRASQAMELVELPVKSPQDLQRSGIGSQLAMTAVGDDGIRRAYTYDPLTGETARMLPWWEGPVEHLSMSAKADLVAISHDGGVELHRLASGERVVSLDRARRAVPHPGGRYVMVELDGDAISLFTQETWRELDPARKEREQARQAQWMETLPEWAPREATPPELHILDLERQERSRITAWYGRHFEWLPQVDYWSSFLLWGVEGKQLHANVAYVDLREKLRMLAAGQAPYGVERVDWETGQAVSAGTESDGAVSKSTDDHAAESSKTTPASE